MSSNPATTFSAPGAGPWQVLLVTDSVIEQKLLVGLLTKHQHRVFVVGSGREALLEWSEKEFDVVILDAQLSEMDGPELSREIRLFERGARRIPIVALTDDESDCVRFRQSGADCCLSRPLQIDEFHDIVRSVRHSAGRTLDLVDNSLQDVIDWKVALEAVGGRRELLAELLEIFVAEYSTTLNAIRNAIDRKDAKGLQMSAHQMKGSLRYFGKTAASELARRLEDLGRSGQVDGAAIMLEPLTAAVQRLLPQLRQGPG